ncbi:MAG TPA: hypothetical protein VGY55_20540 [Pirellulales bacterium]|nr:hypothetical protein [Pirellulales bacterium]
MESVLFDDKSFGLQPLPDGEPTNEWDPDQLGCYAQVQHQQIIDGEKLLTPTYWRLGKALCLAKKNFGHGQWTKFLGFWRIDKTRAARARAIFGAFDNEQAVQAISVEDAYRQRKRRIATSPRKKAGLSPEERTLGRFAMNVGRRAEALIDEAAFLESEMAISLLPQLDQAIDRLQRLRDWLEQQAKTRKAKPTSDPDGDARSHAPPRDQDRALRREDCAVQLGAKDIVG